MRYHPLQGFSGLMGGSTGRVVISWLHGRHPPRSMTGKELFLTSADLFLATGTGAGGAGALQIVPSGTALYTSLLAWTPARVLKTH